MALRRVFDHVAYAGRASEDTTPEPKYLQGTVLSRGSADMRVMDTNGATLTMGFTADTMAWRGSVTDTSAVGDGDFFYAWGDRPSDNQFTAEKVWFNIVNLKGVVTSKSDTGFDLSDAKTGQEFTIRLNSNTVVISGEDEQTGVFDEIHVGEPAQVIGFVHQGTATATRVFTH